MKKILSFIMRVIVLIIFIGVIFMAWKDLSLLGLIFISLFILFLIWSFAIDFVGKEKIYTDIRVYCFAFFSILFFVLFTIGGSLYVFVVSSTHILIKIYAALGLAVGGGILPFLIYSMFFTIRHYLKTGEIVIKKIGRK